MRYRKLSEDGDMLWGNQQADFYINNIEGVIQSVWTRLRLWVGEWLLDTSAGTPYQQSALGTNKKSTIEPEIRDRILQTDGVTQIDSFQLINNADSRTVTILATVSTQYGTTELTGIL